MKSTTQKQDPRLLRDDFPVENEFGIPTIKKNIVDLSNIELIGYNNVKNNYRYGKNKMVHFFVDDYKFLTSFDEAYAHISTQIQLYEGYGFRYVKRLAQYGHVISPDFSLRPEMPRWVQLMAVGKSRWVGAYWQSKKLSVIPSVCWGDKSSFDFCFLGIERGSMVAVSTFGCRRNPKEFLQGYNRMLSVIEPSVIICYGQAIEGMEGNIICYKHPFNLQHKEVV